MSRHEIELEGQFAEGLFEEYEIVKAATPKKGDKILTIQAVGLPLIKVWTCTQDHDDQICLIVRHKVRKYDWSKTLDDVLVTQRDSVGLFPLKIAALPHRLSEAWQPNIHGKCPVDGEACIVRVRLGNGETMVRAAKDIMWGIRNFGDDVVCWQFIRLADGWEF